MADRTLVTLAGAALTATGAMTFARVFDSGDFVVPTLGAAVAPFAIGILLRRARLAPAAILAASLAAGLVYLLAVGGWSPLQGWPALGDLRAELDAGIDLARREAAPVAATTGTVLLVTGATWLTAVAVEALAARGATTGALVPPLTLFVVAIALGDDRGGLVAAVAFAIAAVAFLLLQHQVLAGRRRNRFLGRSTGTGTGLLAAGAAIGTVAVVAGTVLAPALPGAGAGPLFDYRDANGEGEVYEPGIPPVLDVGARLQQGPRTEVFRVRADRPAYWRLVALDHYDGNWVLDAPEGSIDTGLDRPLRDAPFVQEFTIGNLGERWMPAAYEPRRVEGAEALVIRDSATLVARAPVVDGLRYRVVSELPAGLDDPEDARAAATGAPPPEELVGFTALPEGFSEEIAATARQVTAGATSPFEQAEALRDFFRDPSFVYDPNARYDARGAEDGEAVIEVFLEERRGFCIQYAGAYGVMARSLGIPTRLVVGYTPGVRDGDELVVTNHEAHAWPEVWLAGIGWTPMFDPTPPSGLAGGSDLPGDATPTGGGAETPAPAPGTPEPTPTTLPTPAEPEGEAPVEIRTGAEAADSGAGWWWRVAAIPLALAALAGAYVGTVVGLKRRRRAQRRRGPPQAVVIGAWREALDRLEEARTPLPSTATPLELATALPDPDAASALRALAGTYAATRYGDRPAGDPQAALAWEQVVVFEEAFASEVRVTTRWRRRLRARGAR